MAKKKAEEPKVVADEKQPTKVFVDWNKHVCIAVRSTINAVTFIPLSIEGLELVTWSRKKFEEHYDELLGYPPQRAERHFVSMAQLHGATVGVMDELRLLTTVTEKEYIMATTKKAAAAARTAASKPARAPKEPGPPKEPKARAESASGSFMQHIMDGKLTDDQIFATVQEKFGLSDDKRGYVGWYRNKLKKDGKNPPAAKGGNEPKAEAPKAKAKAEPKAKAKAAPKAKAKTPAKKK